MATLTLPDTDLVAFLAPEAVNDFELHLLCTWGAITHHGEELLAAMSNWVFSSERRNTRSNLGRFLEPIEVRLGWFPVA